MGRQYLDAAKLLQQGVNDVDHAVNLQQFRLRAIFKTHYKKVFTTAYKETLKHLEQVDKLEKAVEMDATFQASMESWVQTTTAQKVTQINGATKRAIQKRIQKGVDAGMGYKEIATSVRKLKGITTNYRAGMIARTETHGAFNYATDKAVEGTGRSYTRVWSSSLDSRTRAAHLRANRQRRKQGVPFDVWSEHLMFPGDPGGSAKNIINCRCALTYSRRMGR